MKAKVLIILLLCMYVVSLLVGHLCNFIAVDYYEGKMPVIREIAIKYSGSEKVEAKEEEGVIFIDEGDKYSKLVDRYPKIMNTEDIGYIYYSIGDIVLFCSWVELIITIILASVYIIMYVQKDRHS